MSLTKTTTGAINQMMCVDGTTAVLDAIHGAVAPPNNFNLTGGVGGVWPGDSSNFRTLLGAQAPVIAQATDNLLANAKATFTPYTGWDAYGANQVSAQGPVDDDGSGSVKVTSAGGDADSGVNKNTGVILTAGQPYTASFRVKANNAGAIGNAVFVYFDWVAGTSVTLTSNWQTVRCSIAAASATNVALYCITTTGNADGDEWLISSAQVESGSVATPFALDSRTACSMSIPTATIGLVPGQSLSALFVVNTPWAGNDGVNHYLFDNDGTGSSAISVLKDTGSNLVVQTSDNGGILKYKYGSVAATWLANVNNVVIATLSAANVQQIFLNGTTLTTSGGAGGRETTLNANTFIGSLTAGAFPVNGAILAALWGRVLTAGEITALSSPATWASVIDLPAITVTGLNTGNAVRLYDSSGNVHASAVEAGGTATLTYTLD